MAWIALLVTGLVLVGAVLYWELQLAEGAHLGAGVVVWLYDRTAHRYESIKEFDPQFDDDFLGFPLTKALVAIPEPLVLDVAAGTCRLARALLRQTAFDGHIVAVDLSLCMLQEGRRQIKMRADDVDLVHSPAERLPFPNEAFDAVTCLEALEFVPDAETVLAECVRVLRTGGILLTTNRVGPAARWLVGKTYSRPAFHGMLRDHNLHEIDVLAWQVDYDLAWAHK